MGYGPFRFETASFAYESIKRKHEASIQEQKIIGGRPSLHKTGYGVESISLNSIFHPRHLPGNSGLSQLSALRAAVGTSMPLVGNRLAFGDVLGRWALKSVGDDHSEIFIDGVGQQISVDLELWFDGPGRTPGAGSAIARLFG